MMGLDQGEAMGKKREVVELRPAVFTAEYGCE